MNHPVLHFPDSMIFVTLFVVDNNIYFAYYRINKDKIKALQKSKEAANIEEEKLQTEAKNKAPMV